LSFSMISKIKTTGLSVMLGRRCAPRKARALRSS
jgi:hypothetical protein